MNNLIILDRDGVINYDSPDYIKSPAEWTAIPGSLAAIALLNQKGYHVAIATNQSGIGRGYYSVETFLAIHAKLNAELREHHGKISYLAYCPHLPTDNCNCRKPKPGLLQEILAFFGANPRQTGVSVIGDSLRDLEAALAAGCQPVLVATGNGSKTLLKLPELDTANPIPVFTDLLAFAVAQ